MYANFDDSVALRAPSACLPLGAQDVTPGAPPWPPPPLASGYGIVTGLPPGLDGSFQAIRANQQGVMCRTALHPGNQPRHPGQDALRADYPTKLQMGPHPRGDRHPDNTTLLLDADCIGLALARVPGWLDQRRMHGLALPARAVPPRRHRPLVQLQSHPPRLLRPTVAAYAGRMWSWSP